jgi:Uma2 family endonuclease
MGLPAAKTALPDFIAWENAQDTKHEFFAGEVFAMVGARRVHGVVAGNLFGLLRHALKGSRCRAFMADMKVQPTADTLFYPDVFVTCDPGDLRTDQVFRHPVLVAEVLSDSTQAFDRGLKFAAYRQIAALREYLLLDPATRRVELFRRNERGNFELLDLTGGPTLALDSLGLVLPLAELFDGVDVEPGDEPAPAPDTPAAATTADTADTTSG